MGWRKHGKDIDINHLYYFMPHLVRGMSNSLENEYLLLEIEERGVK
jgi:hypothetical protein